MSAKAGLIMFTINQHSWVTFGFTLVISVLIHSQDDVKNVFFTFLAPMGDPWVDRSPPKKKSSSLLSYTVVHLPQQFHENPFTTSDLYE